MNRWINAACALACALLATAATFTLMATPSPPPPRPAQPLAADTTEGGRPIIGNRPDDESRIIGQPDPDARKVDVGVELDPDCPKSPSIALFECARRER